MQQSLDTQNGKNFWKKNNKSVPGSIRAVYGAMHPPIIHSPKTSPRKNSNHRASESLDSFHDYQESVNDAWDCGDDEFRMISDVKISQKVVQSTALSVINNHRSSLLASPKITSTTNMKETLTTTLTSTTSSDKTCDQNMPSTMTNNTVFSGPTVHNFPPINQEAVSQMSSNTNKRPSISSGIGMDRDVHRIEKFRELLASPNTDIPSLRKLSWSGIPPLVRADTWRLLNGYLPANNERRGETLKRKRDEYWSFVEQYYNTRHDDIHQDTYRQIHIDIPRMSPLVPLFQQSIVQEMFERILYIWAIRHPASGYVQGINDLVTPFFIVFLHEVIPEDCVLDTYDISRIPSMARDVVEADSFWCMTKLLDGIQDNYTFAQPGIQIKVNQLRELVQRIDDNLHRHLEKQEIDYLQFSFRWFNNLLMREIPLPCTIRLWDTLHAEANGFSLFVLYVCAAFLKHFSTQLLEQRDFQGLMLLLQNLPTSNWGENEVSVVLAEAYRLKFVFADAPNHLHATKK